MNHQELFGKPLQESAREFIQENPDFCKEFENYALTLLRTGRKKISSSLICERIRWDRQMETTDQDFKVNNSFFAYLGRWFMNKHPEFEGCFRTRKLRTVEPAPYLEKDPETGQLRFL